MTPTLAVTRDESTSLRDLLDGEIVMPGDPAWDKARLAWNLAADQRPAAVVFVESVDDVVAVVDYARANGLRVAAQGTGHFANSLDSLADTILVKTVRMRGVEIDPEARTARVEAGVLWEEVALAAAEHGLAALAGSSPDIGVVGYTLGGGLGWLARRYGLAANSVVAVELVTADGRLVRADRDDEPELFWAVRGGGGSFGVVIAIEFALDPVPEVYAGILFFPFDRATEVLSIWREWVESTPDEVTSAGRLIQFPPFPEVPEQLRGQSFVIVEAAFIGEEEDGAALLQPLRELGPVMDTFAMIPVEDLRHLHMDPPEPVPGVGDGIGLVDLTPEAINALVAARRARVGLAARLRRAAPARWGSGAGGPGARRGRRDRRRVRPVRGRHGRRRRDSRARRGPSRRPEGDPRALDGRPRLLQLRRQPGEGRGLLPARHLPRPAVGEGGVRPG
ncbi:MAG TPA: FAD-binding oxidoreductase [Gaiellaceae bacterium]|nr:FAD-binding oxidoreductase [Gaiellaceae bacterium]